jgi:signal transduction histidine kinase
LTLVPTGKRLHLEYRIIRPDGELRWVESIGQTIFGDAGQPIRYLGVGYDITERKQIEDDLRRSEEQLRAFASRLQTATERERLRIARELHDQLGQALTGLKMDLDWIVRKHGASGDVWVSMVQDSMKVVDSTIALVRRLATELRPELLDELGLPAAIEWHTKQFEQRTGISCAVYVPEDALGISGDQKIAVFRIFQEALTNIARHARAQNVLVSLERERNDAILTINDDGVGFVVDPLEHTQSLGVLGMRERALLLGAQFLLKSAPGHGTKITLRIPLEDAGTPERDADEHIDR